MNTSVQILLYMLHMYNVIRIVHCDFFNGFETVGVIMYNITKTLYLTFVL